jgi:hypothetical protein
MKNENYGSLPARVVPKRQNLSDWQQKGRLYFKKGKYLLPAFVMCGSRE